MIVKQSTLLRRLEIWPRRELIRSMLSGQTVFSADKLASELHVKGYSVLQTEPTEEALSNAAMEVGAVVGATTMGIMMLNGEGAPDWLTKHNESITQDEAYFLSFFALGCMQTSLRGGATCLYDGRRAAKVLLEENAELASLRIRYWSTVYAGQEAMHSLVVNHPNHGEVVRYRSQARTNVIIDPLPDGISETGLYQIVEEAIDDSCVKVHYWKPGELLVVNNSVLLHCRQPYEGTRRMARFRYDDPHFKTVKIGTA